jgi:type IV pilus assembly protein PilE
VLVKTKGKGFTLIELLIVIAVISILAALAYPSYQESVRKSRRADAQGVMMELAQWMERRYTENNSYEVTVDEIPDTLKKSPKEGTAAYYNITVVEPVQNSYTIRAEATFDDPRCGAFTLSSTGVQELDPAGDKAYCWRK